MTNLNPQQRIDASIGSVKTSGGAAVAEHPIGVAVGALLGGGTTAATAGLLAGPLGALIGFVIGAAAGGIGGKAVTGVIKPSKDEMTTVDIRPYSLLGNSDRGDSEVPTDSPPSEYSTQQTFREQWHHLDESNKELIKGSEND